MYIFIWLIENVKEPFGSRKNQILLVNRLVSDSAPVGGLNDLIHE